MVERRGRGRIDLKGKRRVAQTMKGDVGEGGVVSHEHGEAEHTA